MLSRFLLNAGQNICQKDLQFHNLPLIYSWLLVTDVAVLLAAIRWNRFTVYLHILLGLLIIGLTLGACLPFLINCWIEDRPPKIGYIHKITGFIVVIWLGLQIISGCLARFAQYFDNIHPNVCLWIKRSHYISSYIIMILAKFNYLIMLWSNQQYDAHFVYYLIADFFFMVFYLAIKLGYWTLSQQIVDSQILNRMKNVKSNMLSHTLERIKGIFLKLKSQVTSNELQVPQLVDFKVFYESQNQINLQKYVIFNDFVYDTYQFEDLHPGGQAIIKYVNKREIDRFLYGCYPGQIFPNMKAHNHSKTSMNLCGFPVAKIERISPLRGLSNYNKTSTFISQKPHDLSNKFVIHFKNLQNAKLRYVGFQHVSQFGQYFTITISNQNGKNRLTRLYTTIWCMRLQNVSFMQNNFPDSTKYKQPFSKSNQQNQLKTMISQTNYILPQQETIPLVIKKYDHGKFTSRFLNQAKHFQGQIIISKPMGSGMKYGELKDSGKVIIVCGGTGLLPFCDFIDILFKRVKYLENTNISAFIAKNDPLVLEDLTKKRQFILLCASQISFDILPLTIYQINYLCSSDKIKFDATFRIKAQQEVILNEFKSVKGQKKYFNQNIEQFIKQGNICQIYICGPPQMNAQIGKIMIDNKVKQELYHFM